MSGEIETKEDIIDGTGYSDWKYWKREITNARKYREDYDEEVEECTEIYENCTGDGVEYADERYPIFWANVQTLRPLIYSNLPQADVRRRYGSKNPVARLSSIMLERATNYFMETENATVAFEQARDDALIGGWGVVKVRFEANIITDGEGNEDVAGKSIKFDFIPYKDYLCSPAKIEQLVRWRAYRHMMDKEELKSLFGNKANETSLSASILEDEEEDDDCELFKRAEVWEIWDKTSGKVIFWSDGYKNGLLSSEDDVYNLQGFFPSPAPINLGKVNSEVLPVPPYRMYKTQAEELNRTCDRIVNIIDQIKAGGLYNAVLEAADVVDMMNNADGEWSAVKFDPSVNITNLIYQKDLVALANVLSVLRTQKIELIEEIRDITGISDIVRGTSKASETATAQKLKSNFAVSRIQPQQQAMSVFIRDIVRIVAELIAENWTGEELAEICSMQILDQAEMEQKIAQATRERELAPEELKKLTALVQEEQDKKTKTEMAVTDNMLMQVEKLLQSDKLRGYSIDIETETTVQADSEQLKQDRIEYANTMTNLIGAYAPMVDAGILPLEAMQAVIGFVSRPFKVGRELEEAFEMIGERPAEEEQQTQQPPMDVVIDAQNKARELNIKEFEARTKAANDARDLDLKEQKLVADTMDKENDREADFTLEELRSLRRDAKQNPESIQ
jgi:hypothetical protein